MNDENLTIKIVDKNIQDNCKQVLNETDLKEMIIGHFKLRDELDIIGVESNQLGVLVKECV